MIILKPSGSLKSYLDGASQKELDAAGLTVHEMLNLAGIPSEIIALVMINGQVVNKDAILKDQDVVEVLAVIGGG